MKPASLVCAILIFIALFPNIMYQPRTTDLSTGRQRPKHGFLELERRRYNVRRPTSVHKRLSTDSIHRNVGRRRKSSAVLHGRKC